MKVRWNFIILELMSMHVEVFLMSLILILNWYLPAGLDQPSKFLPVESIDRNNRKRCEIYSKLTTKTP